ncbi:MAG: hypothetical protein E7332_04485 [Clostridiales bacterium]|nr:hypothetical protein [Clostridiales bacterium]MBP3941881.1 hypothetical protein [Christensenellaceae bacterium]
MTVFEIAILAVFAAMLLAVIIIAAVAVGALKKIADQPAAPAQPVYAPKTRLEIGKNGIEVISDTLAAEVAPAEMETFVPQGKLFLYNTTEREAAMVMAIVAEKTGLPLSRLQFESITKVEG